MLSTKSTRIYKFPSASCQRVYKNTRGQGKLSPDLRPRKPLPAHPPRSDKPRTHQLVAFQLLGKLSEKEKRVCSGVITRPAQRRPSLPRCLAVRELAVWDSLVFFLSLTGNFLLLVSYFFLFLSILSPFYYFF